MHTVRAHTYTHKQTQTSQLSRSGHNMSWCALLVLYGTDYTQDSELKVKTESSQLNHKPITSNLSSAAVCLVDPVQHHLSHS